MQQVISCQQIYIALADERAHIIQRLLERNSLDPGGNHLPPVLNPQNIPSPSGLRQGIIEQGQIGRRPVPVTQIPDQIIEIASFQIGTL